MTTTQTSTAYVWPSREQWAENRRTRYYGDDCPPEYYEAHAHLVTDAMKAAAKAELVQVVGDPGDGLVEDGGVGGVQGHEHVGGGGVPGVPDPHAALGELQPHGPSMRCAAGPACRESFRPGSRVRLTR